eukprot:scaffold5178_cov364-Prasinococcus_capsulatus_cf.AAC.11
MSVSDAPCPSAAARQSRSLVAARSPSRRRRRPPQPPRPRRPVRRGTLVTATAARACAPPRCRAPRATAWLASGRHRSAGPARRRCRSCSFCRCRGGGSLGRDGRCLR